MKSFHLITIPIILPLGYAASGLKSKFRSNLHSAHRNLSLYDQECLVKRHAFFSLSIFFIIFFLIRSYLSNRKSKFYYNPYSGDIALRKLSTDILVARSFIQRRRILIPASINSGALA